MTIEERLGKTARDLHGHFCGCEHPVACAKTAKPTVRALIEWTARRAAEIADKHDVIAAEQILEEFGLVPAGGKGRGKP